MSRPLGSNRRSEAVNVAAVPHLREVCGAPFSIRGVRDYGLIGDAPKNYVVFHVGTDEHALAYIAKKPRREGPIECVVEYLISRIGAQLPLRVAEGRLAQLPPERGATEPDIRFLSRQFLKHARGEQLVHASQLVAGCFEVSEQDLPVQVGRAREWEFYTVSLIDEVLEAAARESAARHRRLRDGFARMMAFDSLVGANDRHAQNWGIVQSAVMVDLERVDPVRLAPVYDTARGLFWNFKEEKILDLREDQLDATVRNYAEKSAPLIGVEGSKKPNHFDVIEFMAGSPVWRSPVVQVIRSFDPDRISAMLQAEFGRLLTRRRLQLIDRLLRYRHARLIRVVRS